MGVPREGGGSWVFLKLMHLFGGRIKTETLVSHLTGPVLLCDHHQSTLRSTRASVITSKYLLVN